MLYICSMRTKRDEDIIAIIRADSEDAARQIWYEHYSDDWARYGCEVQVEPLELVNDFCHVYYG